MSYIFAFISIILLLPVLIFLNIGISKKGKLLIIVLSLFITAIGLLAQMSYPLWQVVLIMLLLVLLFTYLLVEKYNSLIFEGKKVEAIDNKEFSLIINEEDEEDFTTPFENQEVSPLTLAEEEVAVTVSEDLIIEAWVETESNLDIESTSTDLVNETDSIDKILEELNLPIESPESMVVDKESPYEETLDIVEEFNEIEELEEKPESVLQDDSNIEIDISTIDIFDEASMEDELENIDVNLLEEINIEAIFGEDSSKKDINQDIQGSYQDLFDEMDIIEPIQFTDKIEQVEAHVPVVLEEDITPLKAFTTVLKEDSQKIAKDTPVKKENYLAEIEKMLEEE